jgi:hypothetical protein
MPDLVAFIVVQHIEVALKTVQRRHGAFGDTLQSDME